MAHSLYPDDVVVDRRQPRVFAVVERTVGDVTSHEPDPERSIGREIRKHESISNRAFRQFMFDGVPPTGTVLVRWIFPPVWELVRENSLELRDRCMLMADVVKKDVQSAMSGVVLRSSTTCTLQPMCEGRLPDGKTIHALPRSDTDTWNTDMPLEARPSPLRNIPLSELKQAEPLMSNELVIYKEWLGQVLEVARALVIKLSDNSVVEIVEEGADELTTLPDQFSLGDVVRTKKGTLRRGRWIFGKYNPNTLPAGTLVEVRTVSVHVRWLHCGVGAGRQQEPPEILEREELESESFQIYDRTLREPGCYCSTNISNAEPNIGLGSRVMFKDLTAAQTKYANHPNHGTFNRISRQDALGWDVNIFDIQATRTEVTVQWQDCSITKELAIELIPIPEPQFDDENGAWPGQIVITLDEKLVESLPGFTEPSKVGVIQSVRASERLAYVRWCPTATVLFADTDMQADLGPPGRTCVQATIGTADGEAELVSLYDILAAEEVNVRRGDIVLLPDRAPSASASGTEWLGEIVDVLLDGMIRVRLGAAKPVRDVIVTRESAYIAVRWDDLEGPLDDHLEPGEDAVMEDGEALFYEVARNRAAEGPWIDEDGQVLLENDVIGSDWESDVDEAMEDAYVQQSPPALAPSNDDVPSTIAETEEQRPDESTLKIPEAYLILESPVYHFYENQPSPQITSRTKRIQKEHTILQKPGAIPEGVYVRTYESRLDLIRVLFIGPVDTPYANAPFVVDFNLGPDFPHAPPNAFFHDWPGEMGLGGVGRVNPNLYEDGKICLSLLGTWSGEAGESWSASSSTLLQVIVSILGLVLVKEPYFNEAGYETRAGLEESRVPSMLYKERVGIRSKSFLLSAMAAMLTRIPLHGLEGLTKELHYLYLHPEGPKLLDKVRDDVQSMLIRSRQEGAQVDGMSVVSVGACVPLGRLAKRLDELVNSSRA